ncbi:MAG: hypothetical protein ACOY3P_11505, partial [Planctomycetota bacterium]
TLPVLSRLVAESGGAGGRRVALLYAVNTLGAVTGVLLAGFVLDRIAAAPLVQNPQNDREWQQIEAHKFLVRLLQDRFGPQVVNAIRNEAERRKIDVTHIVPPEQPAPR